MWRQQHVVGHHAYTNLDGVDPDIRTTDTDVRSVTPHHGWHPYHVRSPSAADGGLPVYNRAPDILDP